MTVFRVSVKTKFLVLLVAVVAGTCTLSVFAYRIVDRVKVNGPLYAEVVTGKDLIADILPPPEYILESYLTTMQLAAASGDQELSALETKLGQLQKDFEDRQDYWKRNLPEGPMSQQLKVRAGEPARQFYSLARSRFLPALHAGFPASGRANRPPDDPSG